MWLNNKSCWLLAIFYSGLAAADEQLFLEIFINGASSNKVLAVTRIDKAPANNDWRLALTDLRELGIKLEAPKLDSSNTSLLLSDIPGASAQYNAELQQLNLFFPSSLLPLQKLDMRPGTSLTKARRDRGLFVNYDLFAAAGNARVRQSSLWHELHYFTRDFYVSSTGIAQDRNPLTSGGGYTRFETSLQYDNEDQLWSLTLGDVINATPNWGRSIRMGGLRIARDYELSPNLITYPLPAFYGESALPGSLELLINDQLRLRDAINSGPYLIDAMPYISGAGTAQVITTDAQGQETRRELNFYVTSDLLIPGMVDYDATLGYRREDFGLASDNYAQQPVFSGSLRYGFTPELTPQALIQAGEGLTLAGLGFTFLAGKLGVVELSHNNSDYQQASGSQSGIAYSYSRRNIGVNGRYLARNGQYYDLGNIGRTSRITNNTQQANESLPINEPLPINRPLQSSEAQLALSYHQRQWGTFSLGYFRIAEPDQRANALVGLSWSRYFTSGLSLFVNANHRLHSSNANAISLSVSIPLGRSDSQLSASAIRDNSGEWSRQLQAMRIAPYEGGLGWNLGVDDSSARNSYAIGSWRGRYAELSGGIYNNLGQHQYLAEATGALIAMNGDFYASNRVTDAFALVETNQAGIPVMVGNKLIGTTDEHGKLLVPDLYSYLENHLSIDPKDLPANVSLESVEQTVIPRRRGGLEIKFPVRVVPSAIVSIYLKEGEPVPVGAQLQTADGSDEYVMGWNGEIYMERLERPVTLYWAEGLCQVTITPPPENLPALPKLGPFYCQAPGGNP